MIKINKTKLIYKDELSEIGGKWDKLQWHGTLPPDADFTLNLYNGLSALVQYTMTVSIL